MPMRPARSWISSLVAQLALAAVPALGALGCDRPPSASQLREWTPSDHDRAEEESAQSTPQGAGPQGNPQAAQASRPLPASGRAAPRALPTDAGARSAQTLVEVTWETACAPCHGPVGHGDGPNGPMVNAPDITRDDLLSKITDDEIAAQIKNGKNRMPRFDLPEPVVQGLVARIRAMRGR
jgi:hypothetical protein